MSWTEKETSSLQAKFQSLSGSFPGFSVPSRFSVTQLCQFRHTCTRAKQQRHSTLSTLINAINCQASVLLLKQPQPFVCCGNVHGFGIGLAALAHHMG